MALLALAVTARNPEEAIRLPAFPFRFAAGAVALLFWLLALGLALRFPLAPVAAGRALAMIVNALAPHLALSLLLRRPHPGALAASLLVAPAAFFACRSRFPLAADAARRLGGGAAGPCGAPSRLTFT